MSFTPPPRLLRALVALALLAFAGPAHAVTLQQALEAAEANSTALDLSREQVVQAKALRDQAWALVSPKVVAEGSYTINDKEIEIDFTEAIPDEYKELLGLEADPILLQQKTVWAANATISQPLLNASSLPLLRGAYANLDATKHTNEAARQKVRAGAAAAYYGLAVSRGMASLAEQAIAAARHHEELATQQVTLGIAPERALLQAKLAVARAERDLATAREAMVTASEAFASLTGLPRDAEVALPDGPPEVPPSAADALARAIAQQPELAAATAQQRAAELATTAYKLDWIPTVNGRYTWVYNENTGFTDDPTLWMVVFSANWLLWDGGARVAQTREAASKARQAAALRSQTAIDLETRVRTSWERLERARAALASAEREQALADENLRLAEIAYQNGGATWLEVDDARLGLLAAQMSALQERANRDLAAIDLLVAMGEF